jgi:hypothetical protein
MVGFLLAAAIVQAPLASAPFHMLCESRIRGGPGGRPQPGLTATAPFTLSLVPEGRRFTSVLIQGPRYLSSYRTAGGGLMPRAEQWRAYRQGRAIRLSREGMEMMLEPERASSDTYAGYWTRVSMVEHRRIETNGAVHCRILAGIPNEGTRP